MRGDPRACWARSVNSGRLSREQSVQFGLVAEEQLHQEVIKGILGAVTNQIVVKHVLYHLAGHGLHGVLWFVPQKRDGFVARVGSVPVELRGIRSDVGTDRRAWQPGAGAR